MVSHRSKGKQAFEKGLLLFILRRAEATMGRRSCAQNIATLIILALVASVLAQEKKTTKHEVVVTATRDEQPLRMAPYYINVMDAKMLRTEKAPRTLPEVLKYQTGTLVQKTAHGQGSPYIRGFTGFRNLLLIDGIRLNNSVFRDGPNQYWNTVDTLGLNRIESVKGPFSVLYGSDAAGGTINAITRGVVNIRPGSNWDRRLYSRYASAEDSYIGRVESIGRLADNVGLTFGYTFKDFGDLEGGKEVGTQEETGYDEQAWDAKLEYFIDDDAWIVLAHQGMDMDDAMRTHKTIYGIDWEDLSVGKELARILYQDRMLTYLQYHKHNIDGFCDEIHAGISHHRQEEKRDRLRIRRDIQGFEVNTLGAFVRLKSSSDYGEFIYGAEFYRDYVNSFKNTYNADGSLKNAAIQGPVGNDAIYDMLGAYVQDTIPVSDLISVVVGCRSDYIEANIDSVEDPDTGNEVQISENWDAVSGSGRLLYHLDEQKEYNLFAGISQGFRAPNLSDLSRLDSARTDEVETPAPDLDPEKFISYEIGMKAEAERVSGQVAYFYTDASDMIVRTPTGRMIDEEHEITKLNAGDGYVQGVEAQIEYELLDNLKAIGAFTWIEGKIETYPTSDPIIVEEPIDRTMPPTGRFGLHWIMNKHYWVEGSCTIADDADELSTRDKSDTSRIPPGGTPGYVICDLRAGWNVSDDLRLSAAVENITDEDYRVHGSGLNEPGRNLVIAADWVF